MNKRTFYNSLRRFILVAGFALLTMSAAAFSTDAFNHGDNPVFLSTGSRSLLDISVNPGIGLTNSYFTLDKIFTPTIIIDFDDIYESIGTGGYRIGTTIDTHAHGTMHLFGIGVGGYASVTGSARVTLPQEMIGLLTQGIELNNPYEGTGEAFVQTFVEYGGYGSFQLGNFTIGTKIARYIPLAYTKNGEALFEAQANQDGTVTASATVSAQLYSAMDLENPDSMMDQNDILRYLSESGGTKFDIGFVYNPDRNRPLWGASLLNIPLGAANPRFGWEYSAYAEASSDGAINAYENDEEFFNVSDPVTDFSAMGTVNENIYMPFTAGGFYRIAFLPLVDIIPHGAFVFGPTFHMDAGVTVEGNVFPLSMISLSLQHEDISWQSALGLNLNLRLIEIGAEISTSSPELLGMFSSRGLNFKLEAAIGF